MASGVLPGPYSDTAASGTMVSAAVLTEAPVEAPPRPLLVSELSARFCAAVAVAAGFSELVATVVAAVLMVLMVPAVLALLAELLLLVAAVPLLNEPAPAAVVCVPLRAPPEVLTQISLSVSGFCQKLGSTSMTT